MKKQTTIILSVDLKKRLLDALRIYEDKIGCRISYGKFINHLLDCYEER